MRRSIAVLVAVFTAFVLVLGFGFWIHERTDAIPDDVFGAVAGIAIPVIAGIVFCLLTGMRPWKKRRRGGSSATVPAVPVQEQEAARKAYRENPDATVSCAHLRGIELAMRRAGLKVQVAGYYEWRPMVQAHCRVNEGALRKEFSLLASIQYREGYMPERSQFDNPFADIVCLRCEESDRACAAIRVLHPEECRGKEPWFPAAP